MSEINGVSADAPCRVCGGPVKIIERADRRLGGQQMREYRHCPNPECRMNTGNRRMSDKV